MKKLLLFDIDSTLLRAEDATHQAMDRAFHDIFCIEAATRNINFFGRTDPELFQEAAMKLLGRKLKDKEYTAAVKRYLELLPQELKTCIFYLMPGVALLLQELAARQDILLGLETGNIEPAAHLKLQRGNIDHYFRFGGFGSDSESRPGLVKIAIARGRKIAGDGIKEKNIYVIGDSPHDISAGKDCGVNTIAVSTGRADREKLMAEAPSCYFKDLSDTAAFLRCIDGERK